MGKFQIRLAREEEGQAIIQLLQETAQWIKDQGINQWEYLLDGGENQEILHCIGQNLTYVVYHQEEMIATFTLYIEQNEWDQYIWEEDSKDAIYLHRLAVKPSYMKNGVGKEMIHWIETEYQTDKTYFRLDCVAGNEKLNQFYQKMGFELLGVSKDHSRYQKLLK